MLLSYSHLNKCDYLLSTSGEKTFINDKKAWSVQAGDKISKEWRPTALSTSSLDDEILDEYGL